MGSIKPTTVVELNRGECECLLITWPSRGKASITYGSDDVTCSGL